MTTSTRHRHILRSLPLLASALGRRYGVTIRIGGTEAYTDGNVIQLPALPVQYDESFINLVRGYTDHEAAHIRHTDFDVLKRVQSPLERHVFNILEDWRVENAMSTIYPGSRRNFRWLIRYHFLNPDREPGNDKGTLVLDWLLLTVRSWDEPDLHSRCRKLGAMMDIGWPWLRLHIEAILHTMQGHCPDSRSCLQYARQVIDLLKRASCECGSTEEVPPSAPNKNKQAASSSLDCAPSERSASHGAQSGPPFSSDAHHAEVLQKLLRASEDNLPEDMSGVTGRSIAASVQNTPDSATLVVAQEGAKTITKLAPDALWEAEQATAGMRARFHGLLQAAHFVRGSNARRGRLDTHALHRTAVDDPRIFLQQIQRPGINTAVHILMDCSGSMRKRIHLASQATYAVAKALDHTGINIGVTAFPATYQKQIGWASVRPLIRHGERMHTEFSLASGGSTPLGPALWWVMQQMLPLQESRKIVLIITDGDPDCSSAAKEAIAAAQKTEIELYGIGIMSSSITELIPRKSQVIWTLPGLAPAMLSILKQALLPTS
jgi:Mg-chelatase subunit ChlD